LRLREVKQKPSLLLTHTCRGLAMSCSNVTRETVVTLSSPTATPFETWLTDWKLAIGVDTAWITQKVSNMSASALKYQPILQTARVRTSKPNAPVNLDIARWTAIESCTGALDIHAATEGQMYFRVGVSHTINSGTTPAKADLAFQAVYNQCGKLAGSWSGHLESTSTTDVRVQPVTDWLPYAEAEKVMMALVIASMTGAIKFMVVWRTATTSKESPNNWILTPDKEAAWHTTNEETTTAQLTPGITTDMWIQFGLKYVLGSGTFGQADVSTATCVRRA
jgi:hypothetical protein